MNSKTVRSLHDLLALERPVRQERIPDGIYGEYCEELLQQPSSCLVSGCGSDARVLEKDDRYLIRCYAQSKHVDEVAKEERVRYRPDFEAVLTELADELGFSVSEYTCEERRDQQSKSLHNEDEAEAIVTQVKYLLLNDIPPEDIGIITAYSAQKSVVARKVNGLLRDDRVEADPRQIDVDTVDSFQGGEREAIIVSFVRSNPDGYSGFLSFPNEGPRRLNVALTRARKRLVLVGNFRTLSQTPASIDRENTCDDVYQDLALNLIKRNKMKNPPSRLQAATRDTTDGSSTESTMTD